MNSTEPNLSTVYQEDNIIGSISLSAHLWVLLYLTFDLDQKKRTGNFLNVRKKN